MIVRTNYLNKINPFISKPVIKVITGIRRIGKSVFLQQLRDSIVKQSPKKTIIYIDKESLDFDHLQTYKDLENHVKTQVTSETPVLIIDEVQEIKDWEKAIASFNGKGYDCYISGSNAHLLSSDLATLISGRYIPLHIYPLTLQEFSLLNPDHAKKTQQFERYLNFGGFPGIYHLDSEPETVYQYLEAIFNTIIIKDIVSRHSIRNIRLLTDITKFAFDNIGNIVSAKKIRDYLKNIQRSVSVDTVLDYLQHLADAYILYKVPRFDIKGKRLLDVYEKYYIGDIGLRHALLGYRGSDISGLFENLVYLHLRQLGFTVTVGKMDEFEIDFIAEKQNKQIYIQVAYMLQNRKTIEREIRPLLNIRDNFPKYIISADTYTIEGMAGIKQINIQNFLLNSIELE